MAKRINAAFLAVASLVASPFALADDHNPATVKGGFYLGVKGIYTDLAPEATDNAGGVGLLVAEHYANGFGVELEGTRSEADVNLLDLNEDYTLDTLGLYGVYRSPGALYFKVRGGLLWKQLSVGGDRTDKTAFGGGVGGGYDFGKLLIEAEYTYVDKDIAQASIAVIGKF
ncbi:outer membrane beta-barrel protein [Simiduia sp. 21SJ11W-1]|uniref:outer membrane beta-barrel protein n=1 Tax=Simiduia sp. 21SJ11W-1 TaxID=2909669 RepID=UPI00209DB12A|nr:outer membrane beta-barrel protein [Simiduia sp. 21SJ11W-1]UTA49037.1 outer membrane beta-barrel protein [Simiduia sp. 21SJ11W-1]